MQRAGLEQNAVTYGIYHRAVMGAEWPSEARQNAIKAWNKLRFALNTRVPLVSLLLFIKHWFYI